jgi:hypothetical protein
VDRQFLLTSSRRTVMDTHRLDPTYVAELLQRQRSLQAEARHVLADLDLMSYLSRLGQAEHVGSSVSGLMVWRDLDVGARCPQPSIERVFQTLQPIMTHRRVQEVLYREETGPRSPSGQPADQRYYFVLRYVTAAGQRWKIDISVWLNDAPRNQLGHLDDLARRLTDETRLAILWIKDVWHRLAIYPDEVSGSDIYAAVLDHGVRTPEQFAIYLQERRLASDE